MHKGKLREKGRIRSCLPMHGLYFKLYQLQYKDQEIGVGALPAREPSIAPAV